jgi:phosphoribosyl 1,2-cyclic phosphodiesterase
MMKALNEYGRDDTAFVTDMAAEHRTTQQAMTGLMVAWMRHLASLTTSQYDQRNQHAVEAAKVLIAALNDAGTPTGRFPVI